jgi:hypothetical protein
LKIHDCFVLLGSRRAAIFARKHFSQRHPSSSEGMGTTCGNSAHQQPPSGWQVMAAPHCEHRFST